MSLRWPEPVHAAPERALAALAGIGATLLGVAVATWGSALITPRYGLPFFLTLAGAAVLLAVDLFGTDTLVAHVAGWRGRREPPGGELANRLHYVLPPPQARGRMALTLALWAAQIAGVVLVGQAIADLFRIVDP